MSTASNNHLYKNTKENRMSTKKKPICKGLLFNITPKCLHSRLSSGDSLLLRLSCMHKSNRLSLSINSMELNLFECSCVACASWFNV